MYLGSQVILHFHHEVQPAEAELKLLTVHTGASACAEPRGRTEVHIVDDEAVATGVCIQDVCLPNDTFPMLWRQLSSGEVVNPGSHLHGPVWKASSDP